MTTDDPRLDRLWSAHEIEQLAYRYAFAFDSRDVEALEALWAETDSPTGPPEIDIHSVRNDFDQWLYGLGPTVLAVCNHIIEFDEDDADSARGSVYCLAQIDMGERFIDQSILYGDRYVRRDGRWLFLVRRHMLWFGQPRPEHPFEQEPANWPASPVGRGTLPDELPSYQRFKQNAPRTAQRDTG
jgi:SnoaL-like domain